jgi:hypothetical protein
MQRNYQENCVLATPGLAISSGGATTFKYSNTFRMKADGHLSDDVTTANAPALTTSLGVNGVASSNLADDYCRWYTLLADISKTTGGATFTLVHGSDFAYSAVPPRLEYINQGNSGDEDKVIVGYVLVVNRTGANFVPGTTALDDSTEDNITCTYIDAFGFFGL